MAVKIVMPSLGMYTIEGELTRWLVDEGAEVEEGQQILELTTEKTTVEIEAPAAGILHRVATEGEQAKVEGLLGYVLAPGESPPAAPAGPSATVAAASAGAQPAAPAAPAAQAARAAAAPSAAPAPAAKPAGSMSGGRVRVSPVARRLAEKHGIDLAQVTGTGPGGRITEADVKKAAAEGAPAAAASVSAVAGRTVLRRVPLTGVRKMIAARMQQSLSNSAQLTLTREVDAEPLIEARKALEAEAEASGTKVPYDVLLAKSLALSLRGKPDLNAIIEGDEILILDEVHVGIAVGVDSGLIVPVLRDVDKRPILELCREFAALVEKARKGVLQPDEYEGGTVTITNLGLYNIDAFTPILNPPESAILGVGRIAQRPYVAEDGELTTRRTLHLSITFDHRVVDGVAAAIMLDGMVAEWPELENK